MYAVKLSHPKHCSSLRSRLATRHANLVSVSRHKNPSFREDEYWQFTAHENSKPENNFLRVTDKMSSTKRLVPDTEHFVPDIRNTKFLTF